MYERFLRTRKMKESRRNVERRFFEVKVLGNFNFPILLELQNFTHGTPHQLPVDVPTVSKNKPDSTVDNKKPFVDKIIFNRLVITGLCIGIYRIPSQTKKPVRL